MGRSVLAVAHSVMGEDEYRRELHQGGEPDSWSRVVTEYKERCAERPKLRERKTIDDCGHGMLADAKMEIPASRRRGLEIVGAGELQGCLGRRPQIRRTTDQPRNVPGQRVQYLAGGVASGDAPWVGREARQVAVPSRWQLAALHLFDLGSELGELRAVGGKKFMPFAPCFG